MPMCQHRPEQPSPVLVRTSNCSKIPQNRPLNVLAANVRVGHGTVIICANFWLGGHLHGDFAGGSRCGKVWEAGLRYLTQATKPQRTTSRRRNFEIRYRKQRGIGRLPPKPRELRPKESEQFNSPFAKAGK